MSYDPAITKDEFDKIEGELKKTFVSIMDDTIKSKEELCYWLDGEPTDESGAKPSGGLMVGAGALIDSKVVMTASAAIEEYTGAKIHPDDVRKGGWGSVDEAWDHLRAKMRERCPITLSVEPEKESKTIVGKA